MKFSRISCTKKGVELDFERQDDDATEEVKWSSHHNPLPEFRDALQGFVGYVVELIPFLAPIRDSLHITTLNLSTDKNDHVGLIVTATTPVEKAYNKPLVLNTPLVREGGENPSDDAFVLSDEVLELIALVESEARRYKNGEHEQGELFTKEERTATSENTADFNERSAAAEVASTRKPKGKMGRGKKGAAFVPGTGDVANPNAEPLTDDGVRQLLMTVERDVPVDAIARWTGTERNAAIAWGLARQKALIGQLSQDDVPPEPKCIAADATPPLGDGWTDPKPVRVTDDDAQAIAASAEGAR